MFSTMLVSIIPVSILGAHFAMDIDRFGVQSSIVSNAPIYFMGKALMALLKLLTARTPYFDICRAS